MTFDRRKWNREYSQRPDVKATRTRWYLANRDRIMEKARIRRSTPEGRKKYATYFREWRARNKDKAAGYADRYRVRLRTQAIEAYGGKCVCCGLSDYEFLSFDHINGNGSRHRRAVKALKSNLHRWLLLNGYPEEFQLLCMNCNWAKGIYGECPHERRRRDSYTT